LQNTVCDWLAYLLVIRLVIVDKYVYAYVVNG